MKKRELKTCTPSPMHESGRKKKQVGAAIVPRQAPRPPELGTQHCRGWTAWPSSPKRGCPAVQHTYPYTHPGCGCKETASAEGRNWGTQETRGTRGGGGAVRPGPARG